MYNDQITIKEKLKIDLFNKFGESIKNDILLLVEKLADKDTFVTNNLFLNLQNVLPLEKSQASYFINLALELATASAFAPVLLLEKIPTLLFYGVIEEVGNFLSNIKDYGARSVSLFLGSDQLKTEDLIDVLEQSTIPFYKILLNAVNARHQEFGICASIIMRFSAKIETVINENEIDAYLDICSVLMKQYGTKMTELYIRTAHELVAFVPLHRHLASIESWAKKSPGAAEFAVTYPSVVFSTEISSVAKIATLESSIEVIKALKIEILKTQNYVKALENPFLFDDKDFLALMLAWPAASLPLKSNVLFQLQKDNYKNYILQETAIDNERNSINDITSSRWLSSWTFCGEVVDITFIRKRIGSLLKEQRHFSLEAKSIVKRHSDIFDRSNTDYCVERVSGMINVLLEYCVDSKAKQELVAMNEFLHGEPDCLKNLLSENTLVIQAWERDPWVDYGKSDELYSCTGIGDYNAANAPGFLADLNMNKLDIWNKGTKVGRIHLCLIKDISNKPFLLLDCVDGTERIIASKKKFELIMAAVYSYARWLGIYDIKMNYDVDFNTTPKKFIAYVEHALKGQDRLDFVSRFLTVSTTRQLIPYACQTFLESFIKSNGAFVRGALITLRDHD